MTAVNQNHALARSPGLGSDQAEAVDLSSTDYLVSGPPTKGVFVGGGTSSSTLKVDFAGGQTAIVFTGVLGGTLLPISVTKIYKTGTSNTNIVALF